MTRESKRSLRAVRLLKGAACTALLAASAKADVLGVSSERAMVREGPGAGYPVLWEEGRLMPFDVLAWHGDWARVKGVRGESGWVHRSVLSAEPTVVVVEKFARIRSGPGLSHPVAWTALRLEPLSVLRTEGDWLAVAAKSGERGWIYRKLVWGNTSPMMSGEEH